MESACPIRPRRVKQRKVTAPHGERGLAKNFIAKQLIKRGVNLDRISTPAQLKDAAVFQELSLIYGDLSLAVDDNAAKKSKYYSDLFEDELELIVLQTTSGEEVRPSVTSIPLLRA